MRYSILYGRKARAAAYESVNVEFWREFDESTPLDVAWKEVEGFVENRLTLKLDEILAAKGHRPKEGFEPTPLTKEELARIPQIDIEGLPWISYATKSAAKPGEAAWIKANTDPAWELAKAIRESEGQKLELDPYIFTFSGDRDQFITRRPLKKG